LSGNNIFGIGLLFLILAIACTPGRQSQKTVRTDQTDTPETPAVYNPQSGQYEPVEDPGALVDTVRFEEDKTTDPVGTLDPETGRKKSTYNLAVLMPFNLKGVAPASMESLDPRLRRFLHYYGGVKMAIVDLDSIGIHLDATVFDCMESADITRRILHDIKDADAVLGPYDVESLRLAADFAKRSNTPVFSPWTPSIPVDEDNPNFVQLNPGLEAHATAIVRYIDDSIPEGKVYLVARADAREKNRLNLYHDAHNKRANAPPYEELIIADASVELSMTHLDELLSEEMPTIFVLPYYSRNDEDFINAFLRKLHAEQGKSEVFVFGLPQWLTFNKLNADYLQSTNVHISAVFHMDLQDPAVRQFQYEFLAVYATVPDPAAYQGYAFTMLLGESMDRFGTRFLSEMTPMEESVHGFLLEPVYRTKTPERNNPVQYYENRSIRILRFVEDSFRAVD